jgi:hypothetical protein
MLITLLFFRGGDESKEKTSGAELEIGSHVAFFFGAGFGAGFGGGAGGDVMIASGTLVVTGA